MIYIAHRGNLNGPSEEENSPDHIKSVLDKYKWLHCEVDVWYAKGAFYLGHNEPTYLIPKEFLCNYRLWCHAKNLAALYNLIHTFGIENYFWHQRDKYTITNRGYIWTLPGEDLTSRSICILPELGINPHSPLGSPIVTPCAGICTDNPLEWEERLEKEKAWTSI